MDLGDDPFIKKYQGIVLNIVAKYSTSKNDFEDLVQAGLMGLMKAKKTFNKDKKNFRKEKSTKSCAMSSWVYNCVRS